MTLPPMLKVPVAAILLSTPKSTLYGKIATDDLDLTYQKKPPRIQLQAVLDRTGLTEAQAVAYLESLAQESAA